MATGGVTALLESWDVGYFVVETPNFWERLEMAGYLRDLREKPDKYAWLDRAVIGGDRLMLPVTESE